jgi:signal transduction histidine kinase
LFFVTLFLGSGLLLVLAAVLRALHARAPGTWIFIAFGVPMLIGASLRLAAANSLLPWAEGMPYISFITMVALALGITFGLADGSRRHLQAMVNLRTRQLADANESLAALSEGRNRLLGVVAHDVRAPLASIVTAAELLRADQIAAKDAPKLLDLVAANGRATLQMLEDLLDLSAIESGTIPVELRPVDLRAVVQERAHLLQPLLGARDVQIDGPPLQAMADRRRLGQALDNLLSNATKFSPAGAPIALTVHRDEDGHVVIDVADRGAGLTDAELKRLFAPFTPGARRPEIGRSTGLGLAIVKRLVELQNGRVEAHPRPDGGTIFRILLQPA